MQELEGMAAVVSANTDKYHKMRRLDLMIPEVLSELRPRIRERTGAAPWGVSGQGSHRRPWLQDMLGGGRAE